MTPPSPTFSVVVPCYNYGRYLPECLDSIFAQRGDFNLEVVLVDDASTDNTAEILRAIADARVRIITHAKNQGHAATINDGLNATRGKFVARIDPDDRYRPGLFAAALEKFEAYPDVGLVYADVALIDDQGRVTAEGCDHVHGGLDFKGNELVRLMEKNFICSATVVARREAWVKLLPVPGHLSFHDWYFTVLIARDYEFYYIDRVLADYRVHASNHHTMIARNRTEEVSIFYMLDRVFEEREKTDELEAAKRRAKHRIYAAQYLDVANKYFGFRMNADARRCYLRAVGHRPYLSLRPDVARRLAATLIGRNAYERSKSILKARWTAEAD